jgi:hypothetical protein
VTATLKGFKTALPGLRRRSTEAGLTANIEDLVIFARVMAPLGGAMHKGIIVEPQADHPEREGMICVEFTPPVKAVKPYDSVTHISCEASSVVVGWFDD